mmetsp:Transcript_40435/g.61081  ORF Transcript_40435/g.61081 Transcript_40435/m.61081 type:complete len:101 (-) Transcript_40435:84-386(-)|eukprot:CAMPEP_0206426736 /NCGR_PEP_ID=MMETSP0324_2-20121206/4568_1 /ASSEMBLY_ACC=CAM_ASM_000836 /TAXON_ID=2866 /ORGANISM="Crypthecodinium cohnii, Strain Seligo" /LENGTH=100 /DNA_ID=CAMNT_0053891773 /DNA_START=62 /DNA_END=364 /DNA_ORIENTATION=+
MAVFNNTELTIKVLEPSKDGKGDFYWGMIKNAAPSDLFKIKGSSDMKIKELKGAISKAKGYPVEGQKLMYFGGELEDSRTLISCGFQNTDDPLLHLIAAK